MKLVAPSFRLRPEVAAKLGYYVYVYVDPRNGEIFYVGKGRRDRVYAHMKETRNSAKRRRIRAICAKKGRKPRIDILAHGITDQQAVLRVEAAVIDALGLEEQLTNEIRGQGAAKWGRTPLAELEFQYAAKPTTVTDPCILIRPNQLYRTGMSKQELYEATRGIWKMGLRRKKAVYAMAVYEGVVRQVYRIFRWYTAGTTRYRTRTFTLAKRRRRWEFTGSVATTLSRRYKGRSVRAYFPAHSQTSFTYVNC